MENRRKERRLSIPALDLAQNYHVYPRQEAMRQRLSFTDAEMLAPYLGISEEFSPPC